MIRIQLVAVRTRVRTVDGEKTVPWVQFWGSGWERAKRRTSEFWRSRKPPWLAKGFGATSVDEVIAEAGLTKSGFFHHFKNKNALAHDMLRRYVATSDQLFDDIFARAGRPRRCAIIMSKTLNDPSRVERQIMIFRSRIKLMFLR